MIHGIQFNCQSRNSRCCEVMGILVLADWIPQIYAQFWSNGKNCWGSKTRFRMATTFSRKKSASAMMWNRRRRGINRDDIDKNVRIFLSGLPRRGCPLTSDLGQEICDILTKLCRFWLRPFGILKNSQHSTEIVFKNTELMRYLFQAKFFKH